MSENRVLRRIFGCQKKEEIRGWRKLLNEELHNFYSSLNIISVQIKKDEIGRAGTCVGDLRNMYKI
jgi:hypothetical protein